MKDGRDGVIGRGNEESLMHWGELSDCYDEIAMESGDYTKEGNEYADKVQGMDWVT